MNVPYNSEVIGESAILFDKSVDDLCDKMEFILRHPQIATAHRKKAVERVSKFYTWDKIISYYENLFLAYQMD